ncbi:MULTISPECIES: hypothetical protein [Wolbachia]|uniref:hypothetical protein n=1 Tax=Wolbachia TaxID=953 RepID=UPI0002403F12|nr:MULTISPECIES: hypothetical protein [Wolbachia]UYC23739.1 hypothetical protein L3551_00435 [Wolbachia endosymbiont of Aedes aegypti]QBB83840.1 hypothetical protein DEJ70_03375 [Wolbachia pipientis wAlbB]QDW08642.1 hypothetical protein CO539_003360 [Wolbachia pipientis]QDW09835.1 hypothetical protein CO538_003365 [Wolbachia pipientis]QZA84032.1 hypothetical protein K1Y75_03280 [Wolbachia pipientis]
MHGLSITNSDNQYQQRKIEALQKENKGLSEKVKTLQKMSALHNDMLVMIQWKAMTEKLRIEILKTLLEAPQGATALQLEERDEDQQVIEDILNMEEERESLRNLESTTIEQTNIQGQSI